MAPPRHGKRSDNVRSRNQLVLPSFTNENAECSCERLDPQSRALAACILDELKRGFESFNTAAEIRC